MSRLIWMVLGFFGGIIVARNAQPMSTTDKGAILLGFIAACGLCWWAAYRGKSQAVAVAIATATATATAAANAEADARASAIASQAVNVLIQGDRASLIPGQERAISREIALEYLQQMVSADNSDHAIQQIQAAELQMRDER